VNSSESDANSPETRRADPSEPEVAEVHLAYQIIIFFGALALGALLFIVLNQPFEMLMTAAGDQTTSDSAAEGQRYISQIWAALPLVIVGYGAFALIVEAVREADLQ
jgi:uncharacterized membrane protein